MKNLVTIFVALFGALLLILLFSLPVMLLWDWLMPKIFGLPEITLLQSIGLQILAYLILPRTSSSESK